MRPTPTRLRSACQPSAARPSPRLDALNAAIKEALDRPGEGARLAAPGRRAGARQLERLAGLDDAPLVLAFTPRFVPPRRAAGELTLAPRPRRRSPEAGLRLDAPASARRRSPAP